MKKGAMRTGTPSELRLIDTDLADPSFTAAMDEALLESAATGAGPTLHFYRRKPPGVTLGYFLKAAENVDLGYCKANGIRVIRRLSGGGAIYTDEGQLVYGLAVQDILPVAPAKCFELVCGALVKALGAIGCEAAFSPVNDVLVKGRKVSGSAIVNRGRTKLVHGTVIVQLDRDMMFRALKVSDETVRKKGLAGPGERVTSLEEAMGRRVPMAKVKGAVAEAIGEALGLKVKDGRLTAKERARVDELVRTRYGTDAWNLKA
jgi:lipoate-protein ligase A